MYDVSTNVIVKYFELYDGALTYANVLQTVEIKSVHIDITRRHFISVFVSLSVEDLIALNAKKLSNIIELSHSNGSSEILCS